MQSRRRYRGVLPAAAAMLLSVSGMAQDEGGDGSLASAITGGEASLNLRYRYEFVDEASFDDNAHASTLRVRLNYETEAWEGFTGFLEFDHVMEVLVNDFNSGAGTSGPGRDRYPVVADPKGPDLNQLYLQYAPDQYWRVRAGRQRIILDDQRFVGGVGWRQNEQTYDSLSAQYKGFESTTIFYSYVTRVKRVFGNTVPAGSQRHNTHLVNANVELSDAWKVIGYAYLIDDEDVPVFSTNTFGLRVSGNIKLGEDGLDLLGEIARQSDTADAPVSFDAGYYRVQAIWSSKAFTAGVGFESLGSDNGEGFRTPLATLHAFNGWADQFLVTPDAGLDDLYLRLGYDYSPWAFQLIYHDFSAETGGGSYGREIDFSASRKFGDRYSLLLKFATFNADDPGFVDTTKLWAMLTAGF